MNKSLGEIHNACETFTKKIFTNVQFQEQRKQATSLKKKNLISANAAVILEKKSSILTHVFCAAELKAILQTFRPHTENIFHLTRLLKHHQVPTEPPLRRYDQSHRTPTWGGKDR